MLCYECEFRMIARFKRSYDAWRLSADHVFLEFVDHPKMKPIKDRTVWIHINIPGQGAGAADLPSELALTRCNL